MSKKRAGNQRRNKNRYVVDEEEISEFTKQYSTEPRENPYVSLDYKIKFRPKTPKQQTLHSLIKKKEIVLTSGAAGTGKSYVTYSAALELLQEDQYKQLIIIVPTVQSDLEIGFLKGSLSEKLKPHADAHLYTISKILKDTPDPGKTLDKLLEKKLIQIDCVSFLRGKTIDNSIVCIEECQNLPKRAVKTILTRIGTNSKYIFLGDEEQIDNREIIKSKEKNGLSNAIDKFKDWDKIGIVEFNDPEDIVRNPLISEILERLKEE